MESETLKGFVSPWPNTFSRPQSYDPNCLPLCVSRIATLKL
nr:D605 [uncultured bacterium]